KRGRARPDREVGIPQLRRHGARSLPAAAEELGQPDGHPAQLVVEPLAVGDVARERLLERERDPLDVGLELARVDPARPGARAGARATRPHLRGRTPAGGASPSAASSPIVATPASARRSSARGPTPGSTRTGKGARNAASRPGRTAVSPPGLRRSEATFATTFDVATPSEHESRVRARTTARTASASARASSNAGATSPRSR